MSAVRVTDRYTLHREIGRGGSGAVWLGRDEVLGRDVAVKRVGMPPGAVDADILRAEREARLAARVNHPNVVAVFDLVETDDSHWLVMEYVAGTTLAKAIDNRGPMPPDTAAPLLAKIADALAAAHAADIVHRDVKPSNILLGDDGSVKLTDFGIARGVADPSLTQTGLVTGSPAYLSPEVASGASATPASDVWSLGATMFHALAGRPPYDVGDNVLGGMYKIVHEEPPRLRNAGWLAPLLEMTMSRDAAERPSMADVRDYLRARPSDQAAAAAILDRTPTRETPAVATAPLAPPPSSPPPADDGLTIIGPPAPLEPGTVAGEPSRDRRAGTLAVIGGAIAAVVAVIGVIFLLNSGGDDEQPSLAGDATSQTGGEQSEGGSPAPSDTTDAPEQPTEKELEDFATSYVMTASASPGQGFKMLTPDYQAQSPDYSDFWGPMSNPRILDISADPGAMTVTYTYKYAIPSVGSKTETVTLQLVREGESFLISGATAS
ncbi:serine/threonine protein kinase [Nocardioides thalensis]|uniref:non-specific serine/threonine protein kinase n=1 Tax=Nocardioides thalensis TaxID=1914755 RepID=A0A853C1D4_9ACTN|nr:serine/threonine-protein kinase [Nocardioides thalensis]NYJ00957.1 serine/threonine protein kinase [Nocardioides thalensis]